MTELSYFEREARSAYLNNLLVALRVAILRLADNDITPDLFITINDLAKELPGQLAKDNFHERWQLENMLATFSVVDPMLFKNSDTLRTAGIERLRQIYEEVRSLTLEVAA